MSVAETCSHDPRHDTSRRDNRFHFVLSDAEIEAIEEWRWANRCGTRAEAVRRLVQIGLANAPVPADAAKVRP